LALGVGSKEKSPWRVFQGLCQFNVVCGAWGEGRVGLSFEGSVLVLGRGQVQGVVEEDVGGDADETGVV